MLVPEASGKRAENSERGSTSEEMMDIEIGTGIVIFGVLYVFNTWSGIALTALRDNWLLKRRLESEERQAKTAGRDPNVRVEIKNQESKARE